MELASLAKPRPKTVLIKELGYNARYDVIDSIPGGEELRMCLKVKTSLGRIRRWREDQCQSVGPFSPGNRSGVAAILGSVFDFNPEPCLVVLIVFQEYNLRL